MKGGDKHGEHKGGGHKKHKKHEEGLKVDAPLWMMSWADMVTLLMALFVAMYSISTLDVVKFQKFMQGIRGEFSKEEGQSAMDAMEQGKTHMVGPAEDSSPGGTDKFRGSTDTPALDPGVHGRANKWRDMGKQAMIVHVRFEERSATLTDETRERLREAARKLRGYESRIEIRGHCSAGESSDPRNLSYARAVAVYEFLVGTDGQIADDRLKITAMGLADPISPDQSSFEKAENRLVEVAESPEFPPAKAAALSRPSVANP